MFNCDCVLVPVDTIGEILQQKIRMSKIEHICSECKRKIKPGEYYEYYAGIFEEDFLVFKTCQDCLSIRKNLFCGVWNFQYILEDLRAYIKLEGTIAI